MIRSAHHTGFTVRSLERSIEFYVGNFGLELAFRWNPQAEYVGELVGSPDVDLHAAVLRIPGSEMFLELLEYRGVSAEPVDPANANPGTAHLALAVDDVNELYETLRGRGVASVSAPVTPTIGPNRGGRAVYMIDPDGFRIELIQSAGRFDEYDPADESQGPVGCC